MTAPTLEPHYTPPQIAEALGVDPGTIRDAVRRGELRAVQIGRGQVRPRLRIAQSALEDWLRGREVGRPARRQRRQQAKPPVVDYVGMMRLGGRSADEPPPASDAAGI